MQVLGEYRTIKNKLGFVSAFIIQSGSGFARFLYKYALKSISLFYFFFCLYQWYNIALSIRICVHLYMQSKFNVHILYICTFIIVLSREATSKNYFVHSCVCPSFCSTVHSSANCNWDREINIISFYFISSISIEKTAQ